MTLDSSALIAILFADRVISTWSIDSSRPTPSPRRANAGRGKFVAAGRRRPTGGGEVEGLVKELGVAVVPFGEVEWRADFAHTDIASA
jgi:hypothetical protein